MTMIVELDASALSQAIKDIANTAGIVTTLGSHTFNEVFGPSRAADFLSYAASKKTGVKLAHESPLLPKFALRLFADAGEIKACHVKGSTGFYGYQLAETSGKSAERNDPCCQFCRFTELPPNFGETHDRSQNTPPP